MLPIKEEEIKKWRLEVENGEDFRDEQLGKNKLTEVSKAGENIDYFESGISSRLLGELKYGEEPLSTINIIYPIVKNIIPSLYWKNPNINAIPKRAVDETSAPYAGAILNHYYEELDIKAVNRQVIFDAYVIGLGVCKIGYATQFGTDMPDDNLEKNRKAEKKRGLLEALGLRKPKKEEEEPQNVDANEYIKSESPYVVWVNPFDFIIDPSANSINSARWVAQRITKILKQVKENPNYSNTKNLKGSVVSETLTKDVPDTEIDNFKTIDLYEIHYKCDEGIKILTLARDGEEYKALRHELSIYKMDGFQFELLSFNKHNHKLYPKSDLDIVKGLQDRASTTLDNIFDQIDKYVPKLLVDETGMTEEGKRALRDGDVGSICFTNKNPNEVIKEASFTQLKGDLMVFIDKIMEIMLLETGLTKAQMMGVTTADTATGEQIAQGGSNLRMSDKFDLVADYASKQARKLWQVAQQFVDMEEVELITGEKGIDEATGLPKFDWMKPIDGELSTKLIQGEYKFRIDVGNLEKPDLPVLRSQVERIANILAQPNVMMAFQQQGYKINLAEFGKKYLGLFPYLFTDVGKIIQPITENTTGLIPPNIAPPKKQGAPLNSQTTPQPPNIANILSGQTGGNGGFGGA